MAFPVVAATAVSAETGSATAHTITLPSGIASGHLLAIGYIDKPGGGAITLPDGTYVTPTNGTGEQTGGGTCRCTTVYHQCDGGEGASIQFTTAAGTRSAHVVYRITGHENPSTQPPEAANANGANGAPDPPNLAPVGGAKDFLYLAFGGSSHGAVLTVQADYGNFITTTSGGTTVAHVGGALSARALNAASEDPAAFGSDSSSVAEWAAVTWAIHPAGGAAATSLVIPRRTMHLIRR